MRGFHSVLRLPPSPGDTNSFFLSFPSFHSRLSPFRSRCEEGRGLFGDLSVVKTLSRGRNNPGNGQTGHQNIGLGRLQPSNQWEIPSLADNHLHACQPETAVGCEGSKAHSQHTPWPPSEIDQYPPARSIPGCRPSGTDPDRQGELGARQLGGGLEEHVVSSRSEWTTFSVHHLIRDDSSYTASDGMATQAAAVRGRTARATSGSG